MAAMMILNPRKRGAKKKKPSAKQLAARRKFAAAARARAKAARAAKKKTRTRTRSTAQRKKAPTMAKRRKSTSVRRRRRSPLRRFSRRARRNPIVPRNFVDTHVKPAAIGAAGALLNDMAIGRLVSMLPAQLQKQEMRHLVKGISAVGLAALASKAKVSSRSTIQTATVGALTCVMHDAARAQVQKMLPSIALGEYLSEVAGPWPGYDEGMGEYLDESGFDAIADASDYGDDDGMAELEDTDDAEIFA